VKSSHGKVIRHHMYERMFMLGGFRISENFGIEC
jgi:hypothetical protein